MVLQSFEFCKLYIVVGDEVIYTGTRGLVLEQFILLFHVYLVCKRIRRLKCVLLWNLLSCIANNGLLARLIYFSKDTFMLLSYSIKLVGPN